MPHLTLSLVALAGAILALVVNAALLVLTLRRRGEMIVRQKAQVAHEERLTQIALEGAEERRVVAERFIRTLERKGKDDK